MRKFLQRALDKVSRMDEESIRGLLRILNDENDRLETVLDSMLDGIIVCDVNNIPILVNKSAERLMPLSGQELFDTPLWHNVRDSEISMFFRQTLENEETVLDREFTLDTPQGVRIIALSVTTLVKEKKITGTLIHVEDTTDKRKRDVRLRRAENLASLTTLAAGVAHEIKNPLGAISIHVQLMKKLLKHNGDPQLVKYLGIVDEEIDRLNRIVLDFLFAVRPMEIMPINGDINGLIIELADLMRAEIESSGISLKVLSSPPLPLIPFDRRLLKQAILNLIQNSEAATPKGGTMSIGASSVNEEIHIQVSDTGSGIAEEHLGKIFEPYFTTKQNGTGLGLTLTYKIIKEHGGDISVASRVNQGTTFTISLPIPQTDRKMLAGPVTAERSAN